MIELYVKISFIIIVKILFKEVERFTQNEII